MQKPCSWSIQHAWHTPGTARKPVWLEQREQGEKCEEVTSDGSQMQSQRALEAIIRAFALTPRWEAIRGLWAACNIINFSFCEKKLDWKDTEAKLWTVRGPLQWSEQRWWLKPGSW